MKLIPGKTVIPLDDWVDEAVEWMTVNWRDFFQTIQTPVEWIADRLNNALVDTPDQVILAAMVAVAYLAAGWRVALFTLVAMGLLGGWNPVLPHLDVWELSMTTLVLVITAVIVSVALGVPLGIISARSDKFEAVLRPVLDTMQTIPSFVYLIPVVTLIGLGVVGGVFATVVFAIPPIIRLTNLGIRQVDHEVVEAARSFGASSREILTDVQLPLALRTIMAGLNQTLMLSLSMVVIASIIGAPGLGQLVRRGINNLEPGTGAIGGIGIVVLAIVLDRITQALGQPGEKPRLPYHARLSTWIQSLVRGGRQATATTAD